MKGFGLIGVIIALAVIVLVGSGGLYWKEIRDYYLVATEVSIDASGWKTYRNGLYGFEIQYPEGFFIYENIAALPPFTPRKEIIERYMILPSDVSRTVSISDDLYLDSVQKDTIMALNIEIYPQGVVDLQKWFKEFIGRGVNDVQREGYILTAKPLS